MERMNDPAVTRLEQEVLESALAGDHPFLAQLRAQAEHAVPVCRESSGVGFFLEMAVPSELARVTPPAFELADVFFEHSALPHGGGAVLFVREGAISTLELYAMEGDWVDQNGVWTIHYFRGARDFAQFNRELEWRAEWWRTGVRPPLPEALG